GALARDGRLLRVQSLVVGLSVLAVGGLLHALRNVADVDELVDLDTWTLHLILCLARVKAIGDEVPGRGRKLLNAGAGAMMVGLHETAGRYEGARAAVCKAQRPEPQMVKPALVGPEAIGLLDQAGREVVECPHALVAPRRHQQNDKDQSCRYRPV